MSLKAPWYVWVLIILGIYMAIAAPATLGGIFVFIDHLFLTVAGGISHFLNSTLKG